MTKILKNNERLDDLQFNNLYIIQNPDEYCFTSDAVALANFVHVSNFGRMVDLCSGSGVVGILANAKNKIKDVILVQVQEYLADMSNRSIEYNKIDKGHYLVGQLLEGKNIALITDAGTPGISDPGEELVAMCYESGIEVTSLPGAAACITALTLSGLSTRRFAFEAFLPADKKEKKKVLQELVNETRTLILYEAPHRLVRTLEELYQVLGDRRITVCRELTKKHETAFRTTLSQALEWYTQNEPKGECVLVVEGKDRKKLEQEEQKKWEEMSLEEHMEYYVQQGIDRKEAMKQVAKDRGISKRDVYQELLKRG